MNILIENYSEKAIKIYGDTKPIKDALRDAGAKFNPYLKGGPGWIASAKKRETFEAIIYSAPTSAPITLASVTMEALSHDAPKVVIQEAPVIPPTPSTPSTPPTPPRSKRSAKFGIKDLFRILPISKALHYAILEGNVLSYFSKIGPVHYEMDATFDKVSIDASFIKDNGIPANIQEGIATFANGMKAGVTPTDNAFNIPKEGDLLISSGALNAFDTLKTFLSKDELKPAMNGAYFANGKICATDAHRLRVLEAQFESEGVILSKAALELLKHSQIKGHTDYATFEDIGVTLGREWLIEGRYPDFNVVIPNQDNAESTLTFSKKALLPLLENALKAAHKDTKLVVLTCEGEGLNISASDIDRGTNFTATAPASGSIKIGYNVAQLIDVLKSIEADEVTVHYFGESRPSLLNLTSLLMPVMINNN
jgi:hypothetical protein